MKIHIAIIAFLIALTHPGLIIYAEEAQTTQTEEAAPKDYWSQLNEVTDQLRAVKENLSSDAQAVSHERFAQKRIQEIRLDMIKLQQWEQEELDRIRSSKPLAEALPMPARHISLSSLAERYRQIQNTVRDNREKLGSELVYWEKVLGNSGRISLPPLTPPSITLIERPAETESKHEEPAFSMDESESILGELETRSTANKTR